MSGKRKALVIALLSAGAVVFNLGMAQFMLTWTSAEMALGAYGIVGGGALMFLALVVVMHGVSK